jgi:5'(3')-deoxyribonucleotidase
MAKIEPVIYLDLDGVCVDFVSAGLRANGFDPAEVYTSWQRDHLGEYPIHHVIGISARTYWTAIAALGAEFWENLEEYPWFWELYNTLQDTAPVLFLTSSTRAPATLSGKMQWLQNRFGTTFRDYIFTPHKQQLASPKALLIDDYDRNVDDFIAAGGSAIRFPQLWNRNHAIQDSLAYTLGMVTEWHTEGHLGT